MNSQDVINILNTIAEQIGVTVDYVVPALVKYNIAQYLVSLSHSAISFILAFAIYKITTTKFIPLAQKEIKGNNSDEPVMCIISTLALFGCFILILFGIIDFYDFTKIIPWLVAPKGSVVNYVISMLK